MVAVPLLEETSGGPAGAMIAGLAGLTGPTPEAYSHVEAVAGRRPPRRLAIYPASAGFDLVEELDYLCSRTVEPNLFFNPRFLAPAMPRLEDREVRLAVIRDGDEYRNRLRLLVPFSIERPAMPLGVSVMRTWSSPFGPLGTPLLDRDDPAGVLEDFIDMLARPRLGLPKVFVLPDLRLDGPTAALLRTVAESRSLPLVTTGRFERPVLESDLDGETYLRNALRAHHYREFRRLKRRLSGTGRLEHSVARGPEDIRLAIEGFLALEMAGWKGRERSAMAADRYRAAFAREAVHRLAELDMCRIHGLTLDGKLIASLIVFVEAGVAYTWKTTYDEAYAAYSPG
ncbi:MAG: GNAT family N-acetyltransferase, partial [Rhizobiaceae bacterium]|nr:GNAT family N-acetyltransferase [Rhizobiaceae bacterium]